MFMISPALRMRDDPLRNKRAVLKRRGLFSLVHAEVERGVEGAAAEEGCGRDVVGVYIACGGAVEVLGCTAISVEGGVLRCVVYMSGGIGGRKHGDGWKAL
jgi:hypothetical protein